MLHLCISLSRLPISNKAVSSTFDYSITAFTLCRSMSEVHPSALCTLAPRFVTLRRTHACFSPSRVELCLTCKLHLWVLSKHKQPTLDTAQTCLSCGSHSIIALLAECRHTSWWDMVQCFLESYQDELQNTGRYFRHIGPFRAMPSVTNVQIAWPVFCPVVFCNTAL